MHDEEKQPLSSVGGPTQTKGDLAFSVPLKEAMEAQEHMERDEWTHGFHSYPARMHPAVARVCLRHFAADRRDRGTVVDPFCGSGTVAIEAMVQGWRSLGSDLNPLAVRLARVKTQRRSDKERASFLKLAKAIAQASTERVQGRVNVRADLHPDEFRRYDVHVVKELAGLLEEIRKVGTEADRTALEMVFSSIIIKVSRQRSDTDEREATRTIRKGLPTEFFERKAFELTERWADLDYDTPGGAPRPKFIQADARRVQHAIAGDFRCDLVLTSPPYAGTYDYSGHHARRMAWLGIKTAALKSGEIGSRRSFSKQKDGSKKATPQTWDHQMLQVLQGISDILVPDGLGLFLVGDGTIGNKRVDAAKQLERLASKAGLTYVAQASQPRRVKVGARRDHADKEQFEHLVALAKQ